MTVEEAKRIVGTDGLSFQEIGNRIARATRAIDLTLACHSALKIKKDGMGINDTEAYLLGVYWNELQSLDNYKKGLEKDLEDRKRALETPHMPGDQARETLTSNGWLEKGSGLWVEPVPGTFMLYYTRQYTFSQAWEELQKQIQSEILETPHTPEPHELEDVFRVQP